MTDGDPSNCDKFRVAVALLAPVWRTGLPEAENLARRAGLAALAWATGGSRNRDECELSVTLADDAVVRRLNYRYRNINRPTDVLSFPELDSVGSATGPVLFGEVVLAYETVSQAAAEQDKPLADHLSHLVVHGTLHLLGYEHRSEAESAEMERLETAVLAGLGIAAPHGRAAPRQIAAAQ